MMSVSVTMAYYVSKSNIYARSNTIETPFFNISQKVFFLIEEGFSDYLVGNVCEIILLKCWHFVMKFREKSAITTQPATTASFIALEFCLRFILEEWNHFFQIILFLHHFFYFLSELYKFPLLSQNYTNKMDKAFIINIIRYAFWSNFATLTDFEVINSFSKTKVFPKNPKLRYLRTLNISGAFYSKPATI